MSKTRISIIVPVFNEVAIIKDILKQLAVASGHRNVEEVIFADGGSTDGTVQLLERAHNITVVHSEKGRAKQMNAGAAVAKGNILYFLHADSQPPVGFVDQLMNTESHSGCFRLKFNPAKSLWLRCAQWFTQFDFYLFRGGDQSLFVETKVFRLLGGFDERYRVYEDVDLIIRIKKKHTFVVLDDFVTTSSRRFHKNGVLRLYYHFGVIHFKASIGQSPEKLWSYYSRKIQ